ncbi:hypothetical protein [Occallatibacter riparius]|uniref:Secreted protein n=1 Tax=Occallatibacter riparius TaxID=1002689 RepID=A0A9J7BL73_9BACT|nr:hypothetical protein [Occallatibacter riparius]UWZ83201.1 hypothetical protein MOP44_21850 [Occallatibacter riparius]
MRNWLALLAVASTLAPLQAQEQKPLADAGTVTCDSPVPKGQMSSWITSSSGFSAAVELRQRITGTGPKRNCRATWVLHVRKEGEKSHAIEVAENDASPEAGEWFQENSFEIEAWSTDGNQILAAQIEAEGDASETTPIIYDFISNSNRRIDLRPVFDQMTPANCYIVFYPFRFDDSGNLVIHAMSTDDDREEGTPACFPESDWRYDLRTNTISRMRPQPPKP